jgi:exopolyphosphatase / guanosine-5'-triphosphate,3'-diphosphate pyrophosphatase
VPRFAAVDVGSNTVHVLVADTDDGRLADVAHYVEMPGLGAEVSRTGRIGAAKSREAIAALDVVMARAARHGYEQLLAGATAAVRQATDRRQFLRRAAARLGVPMHLIGEEAEAQLSFLGVASRHAARGEWVMADLGGASTELVAARGRRIESWVSLRLGSGALGGGLSDPPRKRELEEVRKKAERSLEQAPRIAATRLVATGGTASNLPRLLSAARERMVLSSYDLERAQTRLSGAPAAEVARRSRVSEARVIALRAGVEILFLLVRRYRLDRLHVSHEGLRHGMILAYRERGDDWYLPA